MCLKLSMASTGRSCLLLPRWCRGCAKVTPFAVTVLMVPAVANSSKCTQAGALLQLISQHFVHGRLGCQTLLGASELGS